MTRDDVGLESPPDEADTASETPTERRRHGPRRRRFVRRALVGGGLWFLTNRYGGNIDRVADVFSDLDEDARPAPATPAEEAGAEPVTFLLVGSDSRGTADEGIASGGRSDAIVIARFSGDRQYAQLVSIPRDSWVDIPGHGMNEATPRTRSAGRRC
jgi:anionic cell wall polymer biosynthesis LytR-Cps2A-Psr (LCP) family protein